MSTDVKGMNSVHERDVAQLENYIGHGCEASGKIITIVVIFQNIYLAFPAAL